MNTSRREISVLLADDHALVRAGIRALLASIDGIRVLGEAADGESALRLTASLRPDVLLLDISLADMSGLQVLRQLRTSQPATRVVVLSMHSESAYVSEARRSGAAGYLLKDAAPAELESALQTVMGGDHYLSPAIARHLADAPPAGEADELLTARQRQILKLIAEGRSTKEIAYDLELSVKTVETHRAQIMERLQIRDVPGLTRYAIRCGLIVP